MFIAVLQELRSKLSGLKSYRGQPYLMSMAGPSAYEKLDKMDLQAVCSALDHVNIMTYDMHGAWDTQTGHQSALLDPNPFEYSVDNVVANYTKVSGRARRGARLRWGRAGGGGGKGGCSTLAHASFRG